MKDLSRILSLFVEIAGLPQFYEATLAANFWLSAEVVLRALAALFMIACTLVFSVRAVRLLLPELGLPLRWSSIFGVGMYVATMGFHALRGLNLFYLPAALVCTGALGAVAVYVQPSRVPWRWALQREWRSVLFVARRASRGKYRFVVSLFFAFVLLLGMRSLIVPPLGWDTFTYHGPRMVHWLQTNQFTYDPGPGPYALYRHFFGGGEVLMAWALLPFHSDLFANFTNIVQWIGVGIAVWALARALGVREPFAATSGGLAMFAPALTFEMNAGYVEAALNAALLHGVALAIHCLRRPSSAAAVMAAMSLGMAAGIKLPGAPPGAIVGAALLLRFLFVRRLSLGRRLGTIALSTVSAVLPVLPWTYAAYMETGYPLSPMPLKVLGLTLGVSSPAMEWYQERPGVLPYYWAYESQALQHLFSSVGYMLDGAGPALGSPTVFVIIMALLGLAVLIRRRPLLGLLYAAACGTPWLIHFSPGLSVPRLLWAISVARYLIAFLGLAIPVSFLWCRPGRQLSETYRRIMLVICLWTIAVSVRHGFGAWEVRELMLMGVIALVVSTLLWLLFQPRYAAEPARRAILAVLLFAVCCSGLQLRRDQTRSLAYTGSFALHNSPRFWINAVSKVDEPGVQHTIALTGGQLQSCDSWFYYFFMGTRFQNILQYVPVARDGGVAHFGPHGDLMLRADRDSWLERLSARKITDVLSFAPRSIEQDWMDSLPERFQKLDGGFDWGLYRVVQPGPVQAGPPLSLR